MYSPDDDPSGYWLQGTILKRIVRFRDTKEGGFVKNRFEIGKICILNHWGNCNPLPETFTVNLTKAGLWALETIELPKLVIDELTAQSDVKSSKCVKRDHNKGAPEILHKKGLPNL